MSERGPRPIEDRLASLADDAQVASARARSWQRVRSALREPAPRASLVPAWLSGWRPLALASAVTVAAFALVLAQPPRAVVAAVHGVVTATVDGQSRALRSGDEIPSGASIVTPADGWVALRIGDDRVSVDTGTVVTLRELSRLPGRVVIEQTSGRSWHVPATGASRVYAVRTDSGEAVARGTAFLVVGGSGRQTEITTVDGSVDVESATGRTTVRAGQSVLLSAAPPAPQDAPTAKVEASVIAALRDALGRSCANAELPGCVRTGAAFTVLPGVIDDLRIRVQVPGAGTVEVRGGERRTEVSVPGQGTFEIKIEVKRSGSEVEVEIDDDADEVDDDERETSRPSGSGTPQPTESPDRTRSPEPTRSPERTRTAEPTRSPERTGTPRPSASPDTDDDDHASPTPSRSPSPTR